MTVTLSTIIRSGRIVRAAALFGTRHSILLALGPRYPAFRWNWGTVYRESIYGFGPDTRSTAEKEAADGRWRA